jgi:hypothetical protein
MAKRSNADSAKTSYPVQGSRHWQTIHHHYNNLNRSRLGLFLLNRSDSRVLLGVPVEICGLSQSIQCKLKRYARMNKAVRSLHRVAKNALYVAVFCR